ncbi:sensor domain-containing diguanylate cyclase [Actinoplanes sp. NPDC049548]|uniref:sensor domain-containing diguanylate cyclase n=1 Tax=Actinoplanes sp. NPDC049548 TaxID=3155152 RepID=UPI00341D17B5
MSIAHDAEKDTTFDVAAEGDVDGETLDSLLADLVMALSTESLTESQALELVARHLSAAAGLSGATLCEFDRETGTLKPVAQAGDSSDDDVACAGRALRGPGGSMREGDRLAIPLRLGGHIVGVLLLSGTNPVVLRPRQIAALALHFATLLEMAPHRQMKRAERDSAAMRRLLQNGVTAPSLQDAARVVVESAAEAFDTDRAVLCLVDLDQRIRFVETVGIAESAAEELLADLEQDLATTGSVWRTMTSRTLFVGDVHDGAADHEPLFHALNLRAYAAVPLVSGTRPIGWVLCGDTRSAREWTSRFLVVAGKLSVSGALILVNAEARQANEEILKYRANHDALTGLKNRAGLGEGAGNVLQEATDTGSHAALLLIDLNGFKEVNDTQGHQAGDSLLQQVAKRLVASVRRHDMVARLGGDEFAVLLTDSVKAERVAARICEQLRKPFRLGSSSVTIGGSIGISVYPSDASDFDELLEAADIAMYTAKRETKPSGGGYRRAVPA